MMENWQIFCIVHDPYAWYSSKASTAQEDFELCIKDAKAGVPEAVEKLAEFTKFRMKQ